MGSLINTIPNISPGIFHLKKILAVDIADIDNCRYFTGLKKYEYSGLLVHALSIFHFRVVIKS